MRFILYILLALFLLIAISQACSPKYKYSKKYQQPKTSIIMGYYINHDSKGNLLGNKVTDLVKDGAQLLQKQPTTFMKNLVCVVDNGLFTAAGYAFDELEFEAFTKPSDRRRKWWLIHPLAARLSGYEAMESNKNTDDY